MSAHTPGPWHVSKYHEDIVFVDCDDSGQRDYGRKICEADRGYGCFAHEKPNAESIANAHLIAAAPCLAAAARKLLEVLPADILDTAEAGVLFAALCRSEGRS